MSLPAFLTPAIESWSDFYGHHQVVSVAVRFLHLAGLMVGGGTALAADRQVLAAARSAPTERSTVMATLGGSHRVVVPGLAVVVLTGLLMALADTETFLPSRLFWSKMGLVGLLVLNGLGLLAAERAASGGRPKAWRWLSLTAAASLFLWLATLLAGVWLTVAA